MEFIIEQGRMEDPVFQDVQVDLEEEESLGLLEIQALKVWGFSFLRMHRLSLSRELNNVDLSWVIRRRR
jgi:serine protease inhibitor ecotin